MQTSSQGKQLELKLDWTRFRLRKIAGRCCFLYSFNSLQHNEPQAVGQMFSGKSGYEQVHNSSLKVLSAAWSGPLYDHAPQCVRGSSNSIEAHEEGGVLVRSMCRGPRFGSIGGTNRDKNESVDAYREQCTRQ